MTEARLLRLGSTLLAKFSDEWESEDSDQHDMPNLALRVMLHSLPEMNGTYPRIRRGATNRVTSGRNISRI